MRNEEAFYEGYKARMDGRAITYCPYFGEENAASWLEGWRNADDVCAKHRLDLERGTK